MFPPNVEPRVVPRGPGTASEKVIVAVKAENVISKTALAWALTHVVRTGDCITLLAVFSGQKTGRRFWNFPRLTKEGRNSDIKKLPVDRVGQISESCSQMILQLHDHIEVRVRIKVVSGTPAGAVAAEAKSNSSNWVVLDKKLKNERKCCMEELCCNIVVMKGSQPKVLRLNFGCSDEHQTPFFSAASSPGLEPRKLQSGRMKHSTPASSPEEPSTSCARTSGGNSTSSPDTINSPILVYQQNPLFEGMNRGKYIPLYKQNNLDDPLASLGSGGEFIVNLSKPPKSSHKKVFWIPQNHIVKERAPAARNSIIGPEAKACSIRSEFVNTVRLNQNMITGQPEVDQALEPSYIFNSSIREAFSLGRTSSIPPPLCSLCQRKVPAFGKPPRRFGYEELEEATDGFSDENFLAEGGFSLVHKGVLRDGLMVAVKQLKFAGSQGDADFCREVRVLSCAQHRNVVLLIGFCIEGKKRVLVYEYICHGSLDFHLHVTKRTPLDWQSRLKIAIGTARGLRYLHEDCRVGCIVHRDMRPNNILLTHDFEPLVSDFGLARMHSEWDICDQKRNGTSGYLAPEYFNKGKITEKGDVYAFGLVLLEMITGQRTSDLQVYEGDSFLSRIVYPSAALEPIHLLAHRHQLLDPCLASYPLQNFPHELEAMGRAASLCLQRDSESRPAMSKVLRVLEGGDKVVPVALDLNSVGSRSGYMQGPSSNAQLELRRRHSRRLSH